MNRIYLDVTHTDRLAGSRMELKSCAGERLSDRRITYAEDGNTQVMLTYQKGRMRIERNGEYRTCILLDETSRQSASIETEFGELTFVTACDYIKISKRMISTQYSLYQGDQLVNRMHIRWIIKEESA